MSNIIETLLLRNLQEVFGEGDPARRRSAIEQLYTEDCVVNLPLGRYHGHELHHRDCSAADQSPLLGRHRSDGCRLQFQSGRFRRNG